MELEWDTSEASQRELDALAAGLQQLVEQHEFVQRSGRDLMERVKAYKDQKRYKFIFGSDGSQLYPDLGRVRA